MTRLKFKKSAVSGTHEDHWKSFTDVFATVCLMFFFVMVIFGILSSYLGNQSRVFAEQLLEKELELAIWEVALMEIRDQLTDVEAERARLIIERLEQEAELETLRIAFWSQQSRQLANMQSAREDFERIAMSRVEMYKKIEQKLSVFLGDDVYYNEEEGYLGINTNFLFGVNAYDVTPAHRDTINLIKNVLFEIIDEYTDSEGENYVRFEAFEIRGHTDMAGPGSTNRLLASRRANSIVDMFVPDNTPEEARYAQYFLSSSASKFMPKEGTISLQTPEQREANRRVEIIIRFDDKDIERAISDIANTLLTTGFELGAETSGVENDLIIIEE